MYNNIFINYNWHNWSKNNFCLLLVKTVAFRNLVTTDAKKNLLWTNDVGNSKKELLRSCLLDSRVELKQFNLGVILVWDDVSLSVRSTWSKLISLINLESAVQTDLHGVNWSARSTWSQLISQILLESADQPNSPGVSWSARSTWGQLICNLGSPGVSWLARSTGVSL